ncbi:hypothetical protein HPB52_023045 [Rhipicephalus sanguineus]|uniref:Uncharacterized protein n=1 Tax=Rhipicephalus sanguineus TaxID=34632 RepID=A0A9D4PGA6_RHISA|nr:hypothetical protein HPB52_023045 [Rhipicephalus sanguineus]
MWCCVLVVCSCFGPPNSAKPRYGSFTAQLSEGSQTGSPTCDCQDRAAKHCTQLPKEALPSAEQQRFFQTESRISIFNPTTSAEGVKTHRHCLCSEDPQEAEDLDNSPQSKKARLLRSADKVPQKLESDTEDSTDIDDPAHGKAKLRKSSPGIPWDRVLESDTDDSDDFDDPTWGKKTKWVRSPDRVPRKATLGSKMRNTAYKCSVRGCPHANEESPVGLWLFPLPDEMDEALLRSEWLRHVPIDDTINTPLSPRSQFVTASGAARELQPTAVGSQSICTAVVQKSQSMTFADVSVKSAGVVQESQSRTVAAKLLAPETMSFVHEGVESQSVTAAGAAQESQSTTNATMVLEPQSLTLANVAVETESITVAGAAQDVQSTASSVSELPSTTTASMMEATQSEALHDVAAEAQFMTPASEAHESEFIADTAMKLQSGTTTSMGQEPHSITLANVTVESQSVRADGTVQELQSITSAAMVQEPKSMTLPKVAAETNLTAAGAVQELLSTASAATKFHSTTTASVMEAPQSEAQFMTAAPEAQGSESTAAAAMGLESTTATSKKQKPQFQALPDVPADTLSTTAAPEARESESTAAAAMVQEPDSMTATDVITESKCVTASGAAQESHSTTVAGVELKPTATLAKERELQSMIFPDRACRHSVQDCC